MSVELDPDRVDLRRNMVNRVNAILERLNREDAVAVILTVAEMHRVYAEPTYERASKK